MLDSYARAVARGRYRSALEASREFEQDLKRLLRRYPGAKWLAQPRTLCAIYPVLSRRARVFGRSAYVTWSPEENRLLDRLAGRVVSGRCRSAKQAALEFLQETARLRERYPKQTPLYPCGTSVRSTPRSGSELRNWVGPCLHWNGRFQSWWFWTVTRAGSGGNSLMPRPRHAAVPGQSRSCTARAHWRAGRWSAGRRSDFSEAQAGDSWTGPVMAALDAAAVGDKGLGSLCSNTRPRPADDPPGCGGMPARVGTAAPTIPGATTRCTAPTIAKVIPGGLGPDDNPLARARTAQRMGILDSRGTADCAKVDAAVQGHQAPSGTCFRFQRPRRK